MFHTFILNFSINWERALHCLLPNLFPASREISQILHSSIYPSILVDCSHWFFFHEQTTNIKETKHPNGLNVECNNNTYHLNYILKQKSNWLNSMQHIYCLFIKEKWTQTISILTVTWPHPISRPDTSTDEQLSLFHIKVIRFFDRPVSCKQDAKQWNGPNNS